MKKLLISAFAICLAMVAPAALAALQPPQEQQQQKQPRPPAAVHSTSPGVRSTQHVTPASRTTTYHRTAPNHHATTYHHTTVRVSTRHHTTATKHVDVVVTKRGHVDVTAYRRNLTAEHRFHYGVYRAPRGYAYRRWTYGERLPAAYYSRDFWIGGYLNFGLTVAPDGYTWVRYGPDALLIDEYTGEIIQVVYGVFY